MRGYDYNSRTVGCVMVDDYIKTPEQVVDYSTRYSEWSCRHAFASLSCVPCAWPPDASRYARLERGRAHRTVSLQEVRLLLLLSITRIYLIHFIVIRALSPTRSLVHYHRYQELVASGPDALDQVLEGLYETGRLTAFKVPPDKDLVVKPF